MKFTLGLKSFSEEIREYNYMEILNYDHLHIQSCDVSQHTEFSTLLLFTSVKLLAKNHALKVITSDLFDLD